MSPLSTYALMCAQPGDCTTQRDPILGQRETSVKVPEGKCPTLASFLGHWAPKMEFEGMLVHSMHQLCCWHFWFPVIHLLFSVWRTTTNSHQRSLCFVQSRCLWSDCCYDRIECFPWRPIWGILLRYIKFNLWYINMDFTVSENCHASYYNAQKPESQDGPLGKKTPTT